jgi:ferrous iron transport protein B
VAPIPLAIMAIANAIALALRKPAACCQWLALRLLEGQTITKVLPTLAFDSHILHIVSHWQQQVMAVGGEDIDILLADSRYRLIQSICAKCVARTGGTNYVLKISQYIDRLVLNRFLGLPIFLAVMYGMFFVTIGIGGSLQNLLAKWGESYLITNLSQYFAQYHLSPLVMVIFVQGLGRGLMTTINFIPVLGALFFYMILLEESGYMARAAFVIDRLMRLLGLPGKAFVPMLIGFGCNVPAVLASRTLLQLRDRILTIMMSPFMSCGARLAIYALFTAAFFPKHGDLVVFALYCIGIIVAMLTGLLLRYTCLLGQPEPVLMELPAYQLPNIITAGRYASKRLVVFIVRAGKYIVPITMILGVLQSVSFAGVINDGSTDFPTILAVCGRALLPLFVPLGIGGDNWPAVIGLLSGVSAKEVIVGTLNTLYSQLASNHLAIGTVIAATVPTQVTQRLVYGTMYQYFVGPIGAFSYLLFVLLYFPCISTLVVMWRELNYRWALFSLFWSMLVAYGVAVIFYQLATFKQHMLMSFFWLSIIIVVMLLVVYLMRVVCVRDNQQNI